VLNILYPTLVEIEHKNCRNKEPCSCSCWCDLCYALKWPNHPAWPGQLHKMGWTSEVSISKEQTRALWLQGIVRD